MRRTTAIFVVLGLSFTAGCNGGRDQLLAQLQSIRPEERALAVKKLAEQGRPDDLVLFTRAAKDTGAVVRAEAAAALGKSQDPRVVDLLGELLGDADELVQARAAMALAEIKNDKAKAYLTLQYARRGRSTRQAIVDALKAANVPGAMAQVVAAESQTIWDRNLKALQEGTLPERVAAAEELGKSGRVEAVNRLLPLIKDSQVILAAAAVRGLGLAGDPRAVEPITELLTENFPELREAAIEALVRLGDPKALPRLREVALEASALSSMATSAIIALPPSDEVSRVLCDISLSGAPTEALNAARAMRVRGGCPLEPFIDRLTRRGDHLPVLNALQGLGPSAKDAAGRVIAQLSSNDPALRLVAVRAVGELGDASAIEPVQKVYDQESKRITEARADWVTEALPKAYAPGFDPNAVSADSADDAAKNRMRQASLLQKVHAANQARRQDLGRSATSRSSEPRDVVDDLDPRELTLLAATIESLGRLRAPGAHELLVAWRDDAVPAVRAGARVGLIALGAEGVAAAKDGVLDDDLAVQARVAQALAEQGEAGQAALAEFLPKLAGNRLPLLQALERAGPLPVTLPALSSILAEGGVDAAVAAGLLGRLRAREAVPALLAYLEDPTSTVRREALLALGSIGDHRGGDVIARDLNHDSDEVRAAAIHALEALGANPRPSALDALKGDYYRRVREAADAALVKLGAQPAAIEARTGE